MSRCRVPPPVICACTSPPRRMHRGLSCHATRIVDWAARPSPTTWPTDPVRTRRRARGPFLPPTRRNHARCRCSRVIRARAKSRLRVRAHVGQDGVCCVGSSSKAVLAQAASKTIASSSKQDHWPSSAPAPPCFCCPLPSVTVIAALAEEEGGSGGVALF